MSDPVLALTHALTEALSEQPKPSVPEARDTASVLKSMLTENTGRHLLDSGGAYGRAWERNQGVDFDARSDASADWRWGYVDITIDLYHALGEVLEYHAAGDALFERWATTGDRAREPWLPLAEAFVEDIGGVGPDSFSEPPAVINTYNHEQLLSQDIQYVLFDLSDDTPISDYLDLGEPDAEPVVLPMGTYVLLQIHGGCDARGGYTQPRLFEVLGEPWDLLDLGRTAAIFCGACSASWYTYDVGYFEPAQNGGEDQHFEDYDWIDLEDPKQRAAWTARRIVNETAESLGWGTLPPLGIGYHNYPSADTSALCPNCGKGTLDVGAQ